MKYIIKQHCSMEWEWCGKENDLDHWRSDHKNRVATKFSNINEAYRMRQIIQNEWSDLHTWVEEVQ